MVRDGKEMESENEGYLFEPRDRGEGSAVHESGHVGNAAGDLSWWLYKVVVCETHSIIGRSKPALRDSGEIPEKRGTVRFSGVEKSVSLNTFRQRSPGSSVSREAALNRNS